MAEIKPKKLKSFFHQKDELKIIDQVFENPDLIFEKFEDLKIAITNLQITAREYRKAWKFNNLKDDFYQREKFDEVNNLNRRICFYKEFKDLINQNKLITIELTAKKIANKFLKEYRKTESEIDKKEISKFRALEQQTRRLKETLEKQIRVLGDYSEISKKYKPAKKEDLSWEEFFGFKEYWHLGKKEFYYCYQGKHFDFYQKEKLIDKLIKEYEKEQKKLRGPGRPKKTTYLVNWIQTA